MAIVFRDEKGTNLTADEVDENFRSIDTRVTAVEENPPEAVGIDHFVIEGSLLTIVMTDASTHGPFVLPMGQWRWTGEWETGATYFIGDLFTESGNLYFVRVQHVADVTFDPDLFTEDGQVYVLVLPRATFQFTLNFYSKDLVDEGEEVIHQFVADRDFTIAAGFAESQAYLRVATSTATIVLPIYQTGVLIGSITFVPSEDTDAQGGQYGTFHAESEDAIDVVSRDILAFGQPYSGDDTAAGLTVSINATIDGET